MKLWLAALAFFATSAYAQSMPAGAVLHIEPRSAVVAGVANGDYISTCNTSTCRANEVETALASESFCDVPPATVTGAGGFCADGCPRALLDLGANGGRQSLNGGLISFDIGTDDAEKPCLVIDCLRGQACMDGVLTQSVTPGDLWDTGGSLELQIVDIINDANEFTIALVVSRDPNQAGESQCILGDATRHICIESNGAVRGRMNGDNNVVTAADAVAKPGTANRFDWHLIEIIRTGTAIKVYLDGADKTSGSPTSSATFTISNVMSYFKGAGAFGGRLALLAFYDEALLFAERQQLWVYVGEEFGVGPLANRFGGL